MMLFLYSYIMQRSQERLNKLLAKRVQKGKEDPKRVEEKRGIASKERPDGRLFWFHAASMGESQSALILIRYLLETHDDIHILVTTGTVSSAALMEKNLPERAFHQYYPLDYPAWCSAFLDHWKPDLAFWMESELWPHMLNALQMRNIPAVLVNARLSPRSSLLWSLFRGSARKVLSAFDIILCQTRLDAERYEALGANRCVVTDNLKYSAQNLPHDAKELQILQAATSTRPIWVYASTHKGEEELACRLHSIVKQEFPDLLTIIVPRHPERRDEIMQDCEPYGLNMLLRGDEKHRPEDDTDIYIADTFGELGLFYRLCPIVCIGRSFSDDGGGGHNPIEAAQLGCAVLHGPHIQNLRDIFDEMNAENAATCMRNETHMTQTIRELFETPARMQELQRIALSYSQQKSMVLERVVEALNTSVLSSPRQRRKAR